jgi:hypothetical protein
MRRRARGPSPRNVLPSSNGAESWAIERRGRASRIRARCPRRLSRWLAGLLRDQLDHCRDPRSATWQRPDQPSRFASDCRRGARLRLRERRLRSRCSVSCARSIGTGWRRATSSALRATPPEAGTGASGPTSPTAATALRGWRWLWLTVRLRPDARPAPPREGSWTTPCRASPAVLRASRRSDRSTPRSSRRDGGVVDGWPRCCERQLTQAAERRARARPRKSNLKSCPSRARCSSEYELLASTSF